MGFVEDLEEFKANLKDKWLDYYKENHSWMERLKLTRGETVGNNQYCPSSIFILATVTALEPKLQTLLPTLSELSTDSRNIVKALGLYFDPDVELEKRAETKPNENRDSDDPDAEYLNQIRQENNL